MDGKADSFTPQVPIIADLGLEVSPGLLLGAYLGVSFGGLELLRASGSKGGGKFDAGLFGAEYAHFVAGVDYRVNEVSGIGPFADFALGQYGSASIEATRNGVSRKSNGNLAAPSLHEWLTLGVKVTFFP